MRSSPIRSELKIVKASRDLVKNRGLNFKIDVLFSIEIFDLIQKDNLMGFLIPFCRSSGSIFSEENFGPVADDERERRRDQSVVGTQG